ncbi:hypothetical protein FOL47_001895 [Perkinsus chesapeaki]|uniref:N-acetyltransferase domain-containing protein n=1 Tax=Perkinsus chesapeaki TaxID=330153 RepID=A0A7J6MGD5_PERCH|nr:hypothetical protein FOL47_001895 [Perkinsus chesapeaki]
MNIYFNVSLAAIVVFAVSGDLTYRDYEEDDRCDAEGFYGCSYTPCYVAVDTTEQVNVVGFIIFRIPYLYDEHEVEALKDKMLDPRKEGEFGYIFRVWVDESYRRQGIATKLLTHIIDVGHQIKNILAVGLLVHKDNEKAIALYKKLHFVEVEERGELEYMYAYYYVPIKSGPDVLEAADRR